MTRILKIGVGLCVLMAIIVATLAGLAARRTWERSKAPDMPVYGNLPNFSLMERSGRTVQLSDLSHHVVVFDFIYTSCPGPCPMMSSRMRRLQGELKEDSPVRFVSVTVDPETDTREVLQKYADTFGADPTRWLFLTGSRDQIKSLATDGMHLALEVDAGAKTPSGQGPIVHSTRFVLVDGQGRLRGYYDSDDDDSMKQFVVDIRRVEREDPD
ncbi:MAG: SCO family protein [Acidobacteriia bacterium]|nr:SCO family protein [Terriglobia bacterium]